MLSPLHDMTAVILAGGFGTRLRAVVSDRQKTVAEVNGRPFLHYLLDQLVSAGCRQAILCTGYMAGNVQELLGSTHGDMSLAYSVEQEPLGTGGALRLALPLLTSDPVLALNGDSYCDVDLKQFARHHSEQQAPASLVLKNVNDISRYGAVDMTANGDVTRFEEKGTRQGNGLINAGIYLLSRQIIASMPEGTPLSLEREIFPGLIGNGLQGFACNGKFIDIGVPEDYHAAADFFKLQQSEVLS